MRKSLSCSTISPRRSSNAARETNEGETGLFVVPRRQMGSIVVDDEKKGASELVVLL